MKENPFSPQYPSPPEFFEDRKEVLSSFEHAVVSATHTKPYRPKNMAILGDWGIGKTSTLHKLKDLALSKKDLRIFCINLNLSPTFCKDFAAFTKQIIECIKSNNDFTKGILDKIKNAVTNYIDSIQVAGVCVRVKNESIASLSKILEDFWKNCLVTNSIDLAIFFIDDMHYLRGVEGGLYDLRSVFQNLPAQGCNYMLVASAHRNMFDAEATEPLSRFFEHYMLENFTLDETAQVILTPLRKSGAKVDVHRDAIKKIWEVTEGHPYFITFIMHHLTEMCDGKIDIQFLDKNMPAVLDLLNKAMFKTQLQKATDKERLTLCDAALFDRQEVSPSDVKSHPEILKRLEEKDLLIKTARGKYKLYHSLFRAFLRRVAREEKKRLGCGKLLS